MKNELQNWKMFRVESLFTIKKGKTLSVDNKSIYAGDIPCINGSAENNGVMCYLNADITEIIIRTEKITDSNISPSFNIMLICSSVIPSSCIIGTIFVSTWS